MATSTPAPLPLPPPRPEMGPLDLMLAVAANATGGTHPEAVVGAAQTSADIGEVPTAAKAIAQYSDATMSAKQMGQQTLANQTQIWSSLTAVEQDALKAGGYNPPGQGGLFNDLKQWGGDVVHDLLGHRPEADVFNAAASGLRFTQHLARTTIDMVTQARTPLSVLDRANFLNFGGADYSKLWSPQDWADAWDETNNGTKFVAPAVKAQVYARYGPSVYGLALKLATGQTEAELVTAAPTAQKQALATEIRTNTQLAEAVSALNAGHLSLGRAIVGDSFIAGRYHAAGNFLSGLIDATFDFFADPYIIGGKVAKGVNAARYLVTNVDDVDRLYEGSSTVRRAIDSIGSDVGAVREGSLSSQALLERYPRFARTGLLDQMYTAGVHDGESARDFLATDVGVVAMIKGNPVRAGIGAHFGGGTEGGALPHLSFLGHYRLAAKGTLHAAIDFAADRPYRLATEPGDLDAHPLRSVMTRTGAARIEVGVGRFARRAIRLVPDSHTFNPNDPQALARLRDIATMFLPSRHVDKVLADYLDDPSLGARWKVYRSLMVSLGDAAGLRANPDAWDDYIGRFASTSGRFYGPGDTMAVDGDRLHVGIYKRDMNEGWAIPSFRQMVIDGKKAGITQALTKGLNATFIDKFMNYWRPLTLARIGFGLRVALEESYSFLLRQGPLTYLRAVGGNFALKEAARRALVEAAQATQSALGELASTDGLDEIEKADHALTYNLLAAPIERSRLSAVHSIAQLVAEHAASITRAVMAGVGRALTTAEYREAIDRLIEHQGADAEGGLIPTRLSAMHGYMPDEDPSRIDSMAKIKDVHGKLVHAELSGSGEYKSYRSGDDLFNVMYQRHLATIASDDWAREALAWWRTKSERIEAVAQKLVHDPDWERSMRSVQDRAGRLVAGGDISARQAAEDHAAVIVDDVDRLIRSAKTGELVRLRTEFTKEELAEWRAGRAALPGGAGRESVMGTQTGAMLGVGAPYKQVNLADYLLKHGTAPPLYAARDAEDPVQLASIAPEDLPRAIRGPEMVPTVGGTSMRLTNAMFTKVIGPQINWLSRQPAYIHFYAQGRKAFDGMADHWRSQGMSEDNIEDLVHNGAVERATGQVIPFIHNPQLRSEFSVLTRNLMPFWFAQEQFYKRWARTLVYSPWAFRTSQLINAGLQHVGFLHTNPEDGQLYFVYPASAVAINVLSRAFSAFGFHDVIPAHADLVGYVNMLNPGLERLGLPNFGPVAAIPMDALKMMDPHFTGAIDALQGTAASSSGFLSSIIPTTVLRVLDAVDPAMFDPAQYASAQMSAIQYLEATGHGLSYPAVTQVGTGPPTAGHYIPGDYFNDNGTYWVAQPGGGWADNSPQAEQIYLTRVANWARTFFVTRALYGFSGPASPENYFDPEGLSAQLTSLMNEMPFNQAEATFLAMHPDATPMTVFQTANNVEGFLPATRSAMAFLDANPSLTGNYPLASTYFIPAPDTSGTFDLAAYEEQLAEGLRTQKTPAAYWTEIAYQQAATDYYAVEKYKDQLLTDHSMPTTQVDELWTQFSEKFMAANPLFAQMYSDQGETKREEIMTQVGNALADPSTPPGPQTVAIQGLYNSWVIWRAATANYGQPNAPSSSSAQVYAINVAFAEWVAAYERRNPGVAALVQRVVAPDLASTLNDLAAQGTSVTL